MGAKLGNPEGNHDDNLAAFTTTKDDVRPQPPSAAVPEADTQEAEPAPAGEPQTEADVESKPAARKAATKAATKRPATKAAAKKPAAQKPQIPASQPPSSHKVAIPPEIYREMHRVKNRWLQADDDRMDAYTKPLNVDNTFMVTLMAFATATLKAEIEKDGGATTTFPNYIPQKKRS
ncbi:MAG: hypothetical protein DI630_12515 [Gordonia sp. (in: high G+C Gram-positive bacteria)]|nr:MAG: hypothetical protein DI630_12515 [Gordonia sp. (in: high G+C Gram-positive bacteria)]